MSGKLTLQEAADFLGYAPKTLSRWLYEKDPKRPPIRHFKYRGRLWFDRKDLEALKRSLIQERAG